MAMGQHSCAGRLSVSEGRGWERWQQGAGYDGECGSAVRHSYRWRGAVHGTGRSWGRTRHREGGSSMAWDEPLSKSGIWHSLMEVAAWCKGAEGGGGAGGSRLDEGVGGRGRPEGHTHTYTHTHTQWESVLLYGVKPLLIDEILTK